MKLQKEISELSSMELNGSMGATAEERSQAAKFLGRLGGKKSVESRLGGKTKEERSEIMRSIRLTKKEAKEFNVGAKSMIEQMNKSILVSK